MSMYYSPNNINNERCMEPQLKMLLRYVFAISDASQALSVAPLREGRAWWGYRYGFRVLVRPLRIKKFKCGSVQSELSSIIAGIDGGALAIPRCPF